MNCPGLALARAAEAMAGTRFRLGGTDPAFGLDCIGLVVAALAAVGRSTGPIPAYTLRQYDICRFTALAEKVGLRVAETGTLAGDVLLFHPSPSQSHLAVSLEAGRMAHAHAELRRVVISPAPPPWPHACTWRLT
jgi:cell wall-associated NlpC family hydrolase